MDEILEIADNSQYDYKDIMQKDGSVKRVLNLKNIQKAKLQIKNRKWLLSRLLPKKYGDITFSTEHDHKSTVSALVERHSNR